MLKNQYELKIWRPVFKILSKFEVCDYSWFQNETTCWKPMEMANGNGTKHPSVDSWRYHFPTASKCRSFIYHDNIINSLAKWFMVICWLVLSCDGLFVAVGLFRRVVCVWVFAVVTTFCWGFFVCKCVLYSKVLTAVSWLCLMFIWFWW